MIHLKSFNTLEEAYDTIHKTPFVGSVKGIERRAVFASKEKYGDTCKVISDDNGFLKIYEEKLRSFSDAFSSAFGNKLN